jgi:predicted nucleic acid-binding Zn ribbon protein
MQSNESTLKDAISGFLDKYNLKSRLYENELKEYWKVLVGPLLMEKTKDFTINNKKLYVKIENSTARQEIVFMKSRLLANIQRKFGQDIVEEIHIL